MGILDICNCVLHQRLDPDGHLKAADTFILPRSHTEGHRTGVGRGGVFKGWVRVDGEGHINQRLGMLRGGRKGRPVMSFAIEEENGEVVLQIWLSQWVATLGAIEVVHTAQFLLKRRKAFDAAAALEVARTTTV